MILGDHFLSQRISRDSPRCAELHWKLQCNINTMFLLRCSRRLLPPWGNAFQRPLSCAHFSKGPAAACLLYAQRGGKTQTCATPQYLRRTGHGTWLQKDSLGTRCRKWVGHGSRHTSCASLRNVPRWTGPPGNETLAQICQTRGRGSRRWIFGMQAVRTKISNP